MPLNLPGSNLLHPYINVTPCRVDMTPQCYPLYLETWRSCTRISPSPFPLSLHQIPSAGECVYLTGQGQVSPTLGTGSLALSFLHTMDICDYVFHQGEYSKTIPKLIRNGHIQMLVSNTIKTCYF